MAIKNFTHSPVLEESKNIVPKEFIAIRATDIVLVSKIIPAKISNQS